jgi:flagellar biosynthesis/type III secretory pathway protein FliH
MRYTEEPYISLGSKRNFGTLPNKDLLINHSEAEIASFTHTELKEYEDSLKAYRDIKNSLDTAKDEGRAEGMAKGMAEGMAKGLAKGLAEGRVETLNKMVSEMKREGLGYDLIEKLTGLSQKDIDAIP